MTDYGALDGPIQTICMACDDARCDFKAMELQRRPMGPEDVVIQMKYCGVCHSDLHFAAGHMTGILGPAVYPFVPGHELSGVCTAVGEKVTKFKIGMQVGVGCMVDSCLTCAACKRGEEQMCSKQVPTYNGENKNGRAETFPLGGRTLGGYTSVMVVHERFAIHIPDSYPLQLAGPVMCAGVTMYDPLVRQGAKQGTRVGIVGLGGLGQFGIRIAKAMGCIVTVVSRSQSKQQYAQRCGADNFIASGDATSMASGKESLDIILNTVPTYHDYLAYNSLLKKKGRQVLLGLHKGLMAAFGVNALTGNNSRVLGSGIGGIAATQDVIDLCDRHKIYPEVEVVPCSELNTIYEKLDSANDAGVRFVLDIEGTLKKGVVCTAPAPKLSQPDTPTLGGVLSELCKLFCCCRWC